MKRTLIIAEAGVNHNGSYELAEEMIDRAYEAGADIIKFQTVIPELCISQYAEKAAYQKETTGQAGSQLKMVQKLALPFSAFDRLERRCNKLGIQFLSTPFDLESIKYLNNLNMPFWKIPSGEITNYPYLLDIAKTQKPVLMSTGMSTLEEIEQAVKVLTENGTHGLQLLHCNTEYPTPFEDVNLQAMKMLREHFGVEVGYSDHTQGIEVPIAAVAMGATVIEKHFTLDRNMEGPDHKASLEPDELRQMVDAIRHIEQAMGTSEKVVTESERKNIAIARKSIVARKNIRAGELLTEDNITTKRPGNGINPMRWSEVLGTRAVRDFEEDELIEL